MSPKEPDGETIRLGPAMAAAVVDHVVTLIEQTPALARRLAKLVAAVAIVDGDDLLTTPDAATYCGFQTTGALRKAHSEKRVFPIARRGGRGVWLWSRRDLDRFRLALLREVADRATV